MKSDQPSLFTLSLHQSRKAGKETSMNRLAIQWALADKSRPMNQIKKLAVANMQLALDSRIDEHAHKLFEDEFLALSESEQTECLAYFETLPLPERNHNTVVNWYLYYKRYAY
jgi:hypothetical protein